MMTFDDLVANFANPATLIPRIHRCEDSTPRSTYFYYVRSAESGDEDDILLVSETQTDDDYARHVLTSVPRLPGRTGLHVLPLERAEYPFGHVLLAPVEYHSYFKGVLDQKRKRLTLALPLHRCEFSGNETVDEFYHMRRHTIDTLDWRRQMTPKIKLRFDNPKTKGGTDDEGALVTYEVLEQIVNLDGVNSGFIECANWEGRYIEILSPEQGRYVLIQDLNDVTREDCRLEDLFKKTWAFLIS